ncbi:RNI-like protein [Rhizoclosmatium globosum]|uniref:RNI-like protein n=1 Tax=Rhizoclosmatium globosum TaxID=329046 RepID=A0A1Y2B767_9FUNG|nr:RNI-like protein [Rhizoclosmatium globosum]|eukprot:ORY29945.1 RNI-like protein [Rhizoclosmatium globosum]
MVLSQRESAPLLAVPTSSSRHSSSAQHATTEKPHQSQSDRATTIVEEGSADFSWLIERMANNVGFSELSLKDSGLSTDDVIAVAQALEVNNTLETLDLEGNKIGTTGLLAIAEAISANKTLRELKLGNVETAGLIAERKLATAMQNNYTLTALSVTLKDEASRESIESALIRNNSPEYIRRRSSNTHSRAARSSSGTTSRPHKRSIGRKLSEQPTEEEIEEMVRELTVDQKAELAERIEGLEEGKMQDVFDLIREGMPDLPEGEVELDIDALDKNTLWKLLEYVNKVAEAEDGGDGEEEGEGDEGVGEGDEFGDDESGGLDVSWLVEQLEGNAGIMSLQLNDAMLETEDVVSVAEALHKNTVLEVLDLEGNEIVAEGILALAKMIAVNRTLKELKIGIQSFNVGLEAEKTLAKAVASNDKMTVLTLNVEDFVARRLIDKSLERNKAGPTPRGSNSSIPEFPTSPVVKRKSSIDNWKSGNVKSMIWKFEAGQPEVTERRMTKVTVVRNPKGGRVMLEETVVSAGGGKKKEGLKSTLTKLDQMLSEIDESADSESTAVETASKSVISPSVEGMWNKLKSLPNLNLW